MATELRPDGPHSPAYTREVGNLLAEAVRVLNYATLGDAPGLEYPGDAYALLGALCTTTQRMPQLFEQMIAFLRAQASTGRLGESSGEDWNERTVLGMARLTDARVRVEQVTRALQSAQNAIAGLYVKEDPR
jgi:hypothetical protein